jgi:predicted DNA repair protein MutK
VPPCFKRAQHAKTLHHPRRQLFVIAAFMHNVTTARVKTVTTNRVGQDNIYTPYMIIYVGLARTIYIYGVYAVMMAGQSPNIRSYVAYVHGSGQP